MNLQTYMNKYDISDPQMATLVGVTPTSIYRYRAKRQKPEEVVMLRIWEVTNKAVTPNDFYGIPADSNQEGATSDAKR